MDKIKALIVDDKRITGELFGYILSNGQHDIKVVQSAKEAIELIRKQDFDIVFLDIIMPDQDGIQTLEAIKKINADLPVIMMSGYTVEEKRNRIRDLGAVACLDKPVEMNQVREAVRLALGKEI